MVGKEVEAIPSSS